MIVDSHVHVWEIDPPHYPVGPTAPSFTGHPSRAGTVAELLTDMDANAVDRAVLVQSSWSTWDNSYIIDSVAAHPDRFLGQGLVDPEDPDNAATATAWLDRGLHGFRFHPLYYDEPLLVSPANTALWECLAARGVIVQFHMDARHSPQVAEIASCFPGLALIVDHLGYPDPADLDAYQPILDLARYEGVCIKISDVHGRSQEAFPFTDVHPAIRAAFDAFGSERVLWGTGFPGMLRQEHGWPSLAQELRLIREGIAFLNEIDRKRILGANAARVWGIGYQGEASASSGRAATRSRTPTMNRPANSRNAGP